MNNHSFVTRLIILLLAGFMPVLVYAAPAPITGITATVQNGQILVKWTAPKATDIASYRIYYSRNSILGNNGAYDDFQTTTGKRTEYILSDFPAANRLYISVLAVNTKGEESPSFTGEAAVDTGGTASSTTVSDANSLELLSARSLSSTGVLLHFNTQVTVPADMGAQAFSIDDGSGNSLAVTRLEIEGTDIVIHTVPQKKNTRYTIHVLPFVQGVNPGNPGVPLLINAGKSSAVFMLGEVNPNPQPATNPASLPAIMGLTLMAQNKGKGVYRVTATWSAATNPEQFRIRQSSDRGVTFSTPQTVPGSARSVKFETVKAAMFGISVESVRGNKTGQPSFASIELSKAKPGTIKPGTGLPQSGPGIAVLVTVAGSVAGWRMRKKKAA